MRAAFDSLDDPPGLLAAKRRAEFVLLMARDGEPPAYATRDVDFDRAHVDHAFFVVARGAKGDAVGALPKAVWQACSGGPLVLDSAIRAILDDDNPDAIPPLSAAPARAWPAASRAGC